ncbi:MAG TPA: HAMP domain-containing sensor histidine kinase [Acidimicrobiia bacterium]|jgi:signal transduction histidine kinase|nr:HAMP domain-containing sensor histidine kinase [Acidimicrobiia bacterium]
MRRRIIWSIVGVSVVALLVLGIPLGVAVGRLYRNEAVLRLEREASEARRTINVTELRVGDHVALPADGPIRYALYARGGLKVAGTGPAHADDPVRQALRGEVHDGHEGDRIVVAIPVDGNERVVGALRASRSADVVSDRTRHAWLLMALAAVVALTISGLLAWWQARRLTRPVDALVESAERLGAGDFAARSTRSGVPELDELGAAVDATAQRLGELLSRERAFSADASHQLRTPIAGIRVTVENALMTPRSDARAALGDLLAPIDRLEATVDDLLDLARDTHGDRAALDVAKLLGDLDDEWHARLAAVARPLRVELEPALPAPLVSASAVRQVLEVMLGNAYQHGDGTVTVRARHAPGAIVIDVADEGPGMADIRAPFERRTGDGHGIGLALARTLAEAEGGRLVLDRPGRAPVFSLFIPVESG